MKIRHFILLPGNGNTINRDENRRVKDNKYGDPKFLIGTFEKFDKESPARFRVWAT